MGKWIFRANTSRFRIHDFIRDYGFVEYLQTRKVQIGDIVYLYITAPYKRVEYKMIVERTDIPLCKAYDDSAYSLLNPPTSFVDSNVFVRFRKITDRVKNDELCYKKLMEYGFNYTMQSDRPVNDETAAYIDSFFK